MPLCLTFRAGTKLVSIPSSMVERVGALGPNDVLAGDELERAVVADSCVPLIRLNALLMQSVLSPPSAPATLVAVCSISGDRVAFALDELVGVGHLSQLGEVSNARTAELIEVATWILARSKRAAELPNHRKD